LEEPQRRKLVEDSVLSCPMTTSTSSTGVFLKNSGAKAERKNYQAKFIQVSVVNVRYTLFEEGYDSQHWLRQTHQTPSEQLQARHGHFLEASTMIVPATCTLLIPNYFNPGTFSPATRQSPRLAFFEAYTSAVAINSSLPSTPPVDWTIFYKPHAIFRNADGTNYVGNAAISDWINGLFAPFSHLSHISNSLLEIQMDVIADLMMMEVIRA
jgi:hypothetical protein